MIIENLEICSYCNLNCDYCGRKYMKRPTGLMGLEMINEIGKLIENRQRIIWLHFWGEPLLHPHLEHIIFILKSYGVNSCFYTNGTLLDDDIIEKLSRSPIREIRVTMNNCDKPQFVDKLVNKCRFKVAKVWLSDNEYSDPKWGIKKKCCYLVGDKCWLKMNNRVNVTSDGKMVSCVKDYNYETYIGEIKDLDKVQYYNFYCDCL